ncbi:MAG TPA: HAMP domain-containing protein, partial [Hymenobacter sp.]
MNTKSKITAGLLAMLLLLGGLGACAVGTVRQLDRNSRAIFQDNFYSVQLGQQMLRALDGLPAGITAPVPDALGRFRTALTREAGNITEPGERALVDSLAQALQRYDRGTARPAALAALRRHTHRLVALNMAALTRKNEQANRAATAASGLLLALLAVGAVLAVGLVVSVPEAAVSGLRRLTASLNHAAQGNFTATVPEDRSGEFGAVARAFNGLLGHLNAFRHANLAELLTERNRVASIVQTLDEGLLLLDQSRRVIVANPVACALLG